MADKKVTVEDIYKKFFTTMYNAKHIVLIVWESPFGNIEYRSGAFEEMAEASFYADALESSYFNKGMKYTIYVDGCYYGGGC